jgi:hypothetical protein
MHKYKKNYNKSKNSNNLSEALRDVSEYEMNHGYYNTNQSDKSSSAKESFISNKKRSISKSKEISSCNDSSQRLTHRSKKSSLARTETKMSDHEMKLDYCLTYRYLIKPAKNLIKFKNFNKSQQSLFNFLLNLLLISILILLIFYYLLFSFKFQSKTILILE